MDRPTIHTMKASEVRQEWSQLINKVFRKEARIIVEKSGIPVAAIMSIEDLERLSRLESALYERFRPLWDSWEAFKDVPPEEIEREVSRAASEIGQKSGYEG